MSSQNKIKVSIIIPVYNEEKTIIDILEKVNHQKINSISMEEILLLCQSKSKHMLFLMDACYSGLMAAAPKGVEKIEANEVEYISSKANVSARQIITAGSAEEEALEGDVWEEHGVFTLNVLNALNNWEADNYYEDGYITATELGEYLKKEVFVESDVTQTPQAERIKYSKTGEFIFFQNP